MRRVLTGFRPTGKLHLGHYHGNVHNLIRLMDQYECFFFIADWHAISTEYSDTSALRENTREVAIDLISAGLDPEKCVLYRQSDITPVAELFLYLAMVTPVSWLERCPTYKEQVVQLASKEVSTLGFLGYPVLQCADIIIVHGEIVPVGEDQLPHLELCREIVRRFNFLYGEYFKEPEALLSEVKRLPGTDGRKMSKSYGNAIYLSDDPDTIRKKVRQMITDPQRIYRTDPGHPEICLVFDLHEIYSSEEIAKVEEDCRQARIGCTQCKDLLARRIADSLASFRQKRKDLLEDEGRIEDIFAQSQEKVLKIADKTMADVRNLLKL